MSDENLAAEIFTTEPSEQEHDQERVTAIRIDGVWHDIVIGSLDLAFNELGEVEFMADTPAPWNPYLEGKLSDITGLKSLPSEEEDEEDNS